MKKRYYVLAGILALLICLGWILAFGRTAEVRVEVPEEAAPGTVPTVELEGFPEHAVLEEIRTEGNETVLTVRGVRAGRTVAVLNYGEGIDRFLTQYIHPFGVVTQDSLLGACRGSRVVPVVLTLYFGFLLFGMVRAYRNSMRRNVFRYRNVTRLSLIIVLSFLTLQQLWAVFNFRTLYDSLHSLLNSAAFFSALAFPFLLILSVVVTVSSLRLMKREGRTWRNMLGVFLGGLLLVLTLVPMLLGEYLQRATWIDVHNMNGWALYLELFTEALISTMAAYLESVLLATVILAVHTARGVPSFDRDYMLILGCKTRADGTPTPLLKGRADRALAFAKMQEEKTGKKLTFVPSGGRGADEPVAEAACIRDYLLTQSVPAERILVEDRSRSTQENIRFSMDLIRAHGEESPKAAFSTTNYHVMRAGLLATENGTPMQGIGAPTRSYFWLNAFIREFIATLVSEKKRHILAMAALILLETGMVLLLRAANIV